ncbi:uncharacterized protein LOC113316683 [Papaver somniferum]|uniref:uncharacterized protein LOC113316683 n=1 Tax=Papaver somniferum TaxID=3469 RepID=UPI000E6FE490|nr:uncharacterized protein LOC113316683 [Papaver somniferum]
MVSYTDEIPPQPKQETIENQVLLDQTSDSNKGGWEVCKSEECNFCVFMKLSSCKDSYNSWVECLEANARNATEEDAQKKCEPAGIKLLECMESLIKAAEELSTKGMEENETEWQCGLGEEEEEDEEEEAE